MWLDTNVLLNSDAVVTAKTYALKCHAATNHLYDNRSYGLYLDLVVSWASKYLYYIKFDRREIILAAAWCHDVIEDTRQTYNDVKKVIGEEAAEIVYALTNEKGRTRKERANEKYYRGILDTEGAAYVKICDRLANVAYSKEFNPLMFALYQSEQQKFQDWLCPTLDTTSVRFLMFEKLNDLLK